MRKLLMIVLASSAFGGVVGALATAATQSQASPAAIAAAVQRVQDQNAEASLRGINVKLETTNNRLSTLTSDLNYDLGTPPEGGFNVLTSLNREINELHDICENTSSGIGLEVC